MQFTSKLGVFQLLYACLLVALFTSPGEAMGGPMLVIKGSHGGGGGGGGAASILAAGLVIKLLSEIHKKHKGGFSGGFGGGHGYSGGEGHGYSGGGGGGGGGHEGYYMAGSGMGHSFESHDAHLQNYGYEPQGYAWAK